MVICNLGEENAVTTNGQEYYLWSHRNILHLIVMMLLQFCVITKNIKLQT